jgi:hypothetical protein
MWVRHQPQTVGRAFSLARPAERHRRRRLSFTWRTSAFPSPSSASAVGRGPRCSEAARSKSSPAGCCCMRWPTTGARDREQLTPIRQPWNAGYLPHLSRCDGYAQIADTAAHDQPGQNSGLPATASGVDIRTARETAGEHAARDALCAVLAEHAKPARELPAMRGMPVIRAGFRVNFFPGEYFVYLYDELFTSGKMSS